MSRSNCYFAFLSFSFSLSFFEQYFLKENEISYFMRNFFFPSEEVHVFPEADRTSLPEDTVHMQELRRLHINDDHQRPQYRHPPGQTIILSLGEVLHAY